MSSPILKQTTINGRQVLYLGGRFFEYENVKFEIVGSESTGTGQYEVNHIVKNTHSGTYKPIPMTKLINILKECDS